MEDTKKRGIEKISDAVEKISDAKQKLSKKAQHAANMALGYTLYAFDTYTVNARIKKLENELRILIQTWPIRLNEIRGQVHSNSDGNSIRVMVIIKELLLLREYQMGRLSWEDFLNNSFNREDSTPLNFLDDAGPQELNENSFLYIILVLQNEDKFDYTYGLSSVDIAEINFKERMYAEKQRTIAKEENEADLRFGKVHIAKGIKKSKKLRNNKKVKSKKLRKSRRKASK
jgi:hypothetical protein